MRHGPPVTHLHYSLSVHSLKTSTGSISHFVRVPCSLMFLTGVLWILLEGQSVSFFCYANVLTLFSLSGRGSERKDVPPHHALLSLVDYKYCEASRRHRQASELAPDYKPRRSPQAFPGTVWCSGCFPAGCSPCLCCCGFAVFMCVSSSLPGMADLCGGRTHWGEPDCQRRGRMAWGRRQQCACLPTASVLGYLFRTIPSLNGVRLEYSLEPNHLLPLKAKAGFLRLEELEGWKERKMRWQITRAWSELWL